MNAFFKMAVAFSIGLGASGYIKSATLLLAKMAIEAQGKQISMSKFNRMLMNKH